MNKQELVRCSLAKTDAHLVSGGYQEWSYDHIEKDWHDVVHYFCTIVSHTYIDIENS